MLAGIAAAVFFATALLRIRRANVRRRAIAATLFSAQGLALSLLVEDILGGPAGPGAAVPLFAAFALATLRETRLFALVIIATAGVEAARYFHFAFPDVGTTLIVGHTVAFAIAGFLPSLLIRFEIVRTRQESRERVDDELRKIRSEAMEYRLISTSLPGADTRSRDDVTRILLQGAVHSIEESAFQILSLVARALDASSVTLLWQNAAGTHLRVKERVGVDFPIAPAIPATSGVFGGILQRRAPVNLAHLRDGFRLPLYDGASPVRAFLGVPLLEYSRARDENTSHPIPHVRGVLAVDRVDDRPFNEAAELLLGNAATLLLRIIENERLFRAVERGKYEHEKFYQASARLNSVVSLQDVIAVTFAAAREIASFEFGALTSYDARARRHEIVAAEGGDAEKLMGTSFHDNSGLVAMTVKNRHPLPGIDGVSADANRLFAVDVPMRPYASVLSLPLIVRDEAIGTLVLGATISNAFPADARDMLRVIANQAAVALENARTYERLQELATTDGLTGLLNHRRFQERLDDSLRRSDRAARGTTRPVALIICDIDHFKSVNDTYGHPVGDTVLKGVARILAASARKIDVVARYGGEEFAIVLEETSTAGALQVAERIRTDVARELFRSDIGTLSVTISLGIATYPNDARDREMLIERADQALYQAKRRGRDQALAYGNLVAKRPAASA